MGDRVLQERQDMVWTFVPTKGYYPSVVAPPRTIVGRKICLLLLFVLMPLVAALDVWAQDQPPLPTDPSQLERQFDERALPSSSFTIQQQSDETPEIEPSEDIRFVLNSLTVEGSTVLSQEDLRPFF